MPKHTPDGGEIVGATLPRLNIPENSAKLGVELNLGLAHAKAQAALGTTDNVHRAVVEAGKKRRWVPNAWSNSDFDPTK